MCFAGPTIPKASAPGLNFTSVFPFDLSLCFQPFPEIVIECSTKKVTKANVHREKIAAHIVQGQ